MYHILSFATFAIKKIRRTTFATLTVSFVQPKLLGFISLMFSRMDGFDSQTKINNSKHFFK